MTKFFVPFLLVLFLASCNTYKIAERHLNRKMANADMTKSVWVNEVNSDTVEYWDNNKTDKPVMIFVHGFGASTKYQFANQVKFFSEDYRLIMPNLYHFGNTRPGSEKYSVADQVDLVESLIDHLEIDSFSLMGVSYGGLISMELALDRKDDIQKMIVWDAPVKYMDTADLQRVEDFFNVSSVEELFVPSKPEGLKKLMFLATGKKTRFPTSAFEDFHKEAYMNNLEDKRALITSLIDGLEEYQQHEYDLDMPILLIWGVEDMVVPAETGIHLQGHIGDNCRWEVIKKAAHMPNMTHEREFNLMVREFLN